MTIIGLRLLENHLQELAIEKHSAKTRSILNRGRKKLQHETTSLFRNENMVNRLPHSRSVHLLGSDFMHRDRTRLSACPNRLTMSFEAKEPIVRNVVL